MARYRFMFHDESILSQITKVKNLREAWEKAKVAQLEAITALPYKIKILEFEPVYQRGEKRKKKRRWTPWIDIKDKIIIAEMKEYVDELRLFVRLEGA